MKKKYGLKIDPIVESDFIFGRALPYEILQEDCDWTPYLPKKEAQNLHGIDPLACVPFTILNAIEILIFKKYGEKTNWADRWLATLINTRGRGCSPKKACQFLRKIGVVPEDVWPFGSDINTEDKYFAELPPELYKLANEFNEEWDFRYEIVPSTDEAILSAIKCSPLGISVCAWYPRGSTYYKPNREKDNHFTTLISTEKGRHKRVFDSYDNFIKDYEWDTKHAIIQRYWIKKKLKDKSLWERIRDYFIRLLAYPRH